MEPQNIDPSSVQTPPTQVPPTNVNPPKPVNKPSQLTEGAERLKKLSIQVMIGALIGAAGLAVIAVLAGSFSETFSKALLTLLLVMGHALACLAFIEQTGKAKDSSFKFFENAVFTLIVLSFFTSIFGVWGVINGDIVGKLYGTYLILLFACLHGQMLAATRGKQSSIDNIVVANYAMMGLVILLILPVIWVTDSNFPSVYYRLLAASGIIDGTLTILAVILHKLYMQKHPKSQSDLYVATTGLTPTATQKRHIHPLIWLLGIYIVGQFALSLIFAVWGALHR